MITVYKHYVRERADNTTIAFKGGVVFLSIDALVDFALSIEYDLSVAVLEVTIQDIDLDKHQKNKARLIRHIKDIQGYTPLQNWLPTVKKIDPLWALWKDSVICCLLDHEVTDITPDSISEATGGRIGSRQLCKYGLMLYKLGYLTNKDLIQ